jgi:hypothetical protein
MCQIYSKHSSKQSDILLDFKSLQLVLYSCGLLNPLDNLVKGFISTLQRKEERLRVSKLGQGSVRVELGSELGLSAFKVIALYHCAPCTAHWIW